jgi:hypothetical protein
MKTAYFGWECGSLQNSNVEWTCRVKSPITLVGYQIFLSMEPLRSPGFGSAQFAQVLFQAATLPAWQNNADWAAPEANQTGGTNNPGMSGTPLPVGSSTFATAILKGWEPSAVNENLVAMGLSIPIQTGIMMFAGHSGFQQDFECQGVLFYE